jgi:uncharacterized protein
MASLKHKLARLGSPARGTTSEPAISPPTPAPTDSASPVSGESSMSDAPRPEAGSVEALRQEIARILARPQVKKVAHYPTEGELPFVRIETPTGPLYRRTLRYGVTHHVGRFAVQDGLLVDMAMVALLALDPTLADVEPASLLYVDTETTGLAGGTGTVPFLIGAGYFEEGAFVLEQLLLRQLGEETPMLERFSVLVEKASGLVSYNGKSFDLPLLRTRLVLSRLPRLPDRPHLDLVHLARRVHGKRLGACKLTTVEDKVLGFVREGDIPGGEVVQRFRHFLRTGDESALVAVVDHNAWDIVALGALVGLYGAPIGSMQAADLVGVSRTLRRARRVDVAASVAEAAVASGGGAGALAERAEVLRARGERDEAILDLQSVLATVDDKAARLVLAKLFEHHAHAPGAALALLTDSSVDLTSGGASADPNAEDTETPTTETLEAHRRRVARLRRKLAAETQAKTRADKPRTRVRRQAATATNGSLPLPDFAPGAAAVPGAASMPDKTQTAGETRPSEEGAADGGEPSASTKQRSS